MIYILKDLLATEYTVVLRTNLITYLIETNVIKTFIPENFYIRIQQLANPISDVYDQPLNYVSYTSAITNISGNINYVKFELFNFNDIDNNTVTINNLTVGQYKYDLTYIEPDFNVITNIDQGLFVVVDDTIESPRNTTNTNDVYK